MTLISSKDPPKILRRSARDQDRTCFLPMDAVKVMPRAERGQVPELVVASS